MSESASSSKKIHINLNDADAWDDTLLIKAYDESLLLAKEEVAKKLAQATNKKSPPENSATENPKPTSYQIGDYVRATYSDGIDYEAKILNIIDDGNVSLIKYVAYDNEDFVDVNKLAPSWGKKARKEQLQAANKDKNWHNFTACTSESSDGTAEQRPFEQPKKNKSTKRNPYNHLNASHTHQMPFPPPPPMPPMLDDCEDAEHLSAMLMSWYMSGYYTGLYQGQKISKSRQHK